MRVLPLILAIGAAAAISAQTPPPKVIESDLIARVRAKLAETIAQQAEYSCTQTVERSLYERGPGALTGCDTFEKDPPGPASKLRRITRDRLRLDVAMRVGEEIYSFPGEDQFDPQRLAEVVGHGPSSTGSFGGHLAEIFGKAAPGLFPFADVNQNGRRLLRFEFTVAREKSAYQIGSNPTPPVAFSGTILIDPQSLDLVRLLVRAPHSPDYRTCGAVTSVDFSRRDLAGSSVLLPAQAVLQIPTQNGGGTESRTVYSACRTLPPGSITAGVEQQLPLGGMIGGASSSTYPSPTPGWLPSDLAFVVTFEQDIDSSTAAAGDAIRARTVTAMRDKSARALVPVGAPVTARILRIQQRDESETLELVVRLDAIEVAGVSQPLFARALGKTERGAALLHFYNLGGNYVIKKGTESRWVTTDF